MDGQLRSHEPHLRYRMTQYEETKRAIEGRGGVRRRLCDGCACIAARAPCDLLGAKAMFSAGWLLCAARGRSHASVRITVTDGDQLARACTVL